MEARRILALSTAILAFLPLHTPAQESLIRVEEHPAGGRLEVHEIHNSILNETRRVAVYLHRDYDASQRSYPVVLLLPAYADFPSFLNEYDAPATMESLVAQGRMQPLILAMPYVPATVTNRGAPDELRYMVTDLVPFLGAHFRTFADRGITGISGHFFGVVESFYVALRYPEVFRLAGGYEMCWRGGSLPGEVFPLLRAHRQGQTPLSFWVASEKSSNCASSRPVADLLDSLDVPHVYLDDGDSREWLADNLIYFSARLQEAIGEGGPHVLSGIDVTAVAGQTTDVAVVLEAPLVPPASSLSLDATAAGGSLLPLSHGGNGRYTGRLRMPEEPGLYLLPLLRGMGADAPAYFAALRLSVYPASDLVILDEDVGPGWSLDRVIGVQEVVTNAGELAFAGRSAAKIHGKKSSSGWVVSLVPEDTASAFSYSALRFAFAAGQADLDATGRFGVKLTPGRMVDLRERVDFTKSGWQVVEIPLAAFALVPPPFPGGVERLNFTGTFEGVFYIDDLRLVASKAPVTPTAVLEEQDDSRPQAFSLRQNYPNPFNSGTVIRFDLPSEGQVELAVYNLAGQKVATLVDGVRQAGTYTIHWDGLDDRGQALASGLYLYHLRAGDRVESRRLLVLR